MNELQQKTAQAIVNIFETGRARGAYSGLTVIKGDSGHLSYGRSQASLGSGALFKLLESYCQKTNARYANDLKPALARFERKDISLDTDSSVKQLLKSAGDDDPVMRETQDEFFKRGYFAPAIAAAEALGIADALGQTVVYDSHIQGGWGTVKKRVGAVVAGNARAWVKKYIELRAAWLSSLKPPLPGTVYRMKAFSALIEANNWDLALPLDVRGITISLEALSDEQPSTGAAPRALRLMRPYLRGPDVEALQVALKQKGQPAIVDRVYGPFTHQIVLKWQADNGIQEDGVVGAKTRASLGL